MREGKRVLFLKNDLCITICRQRLAARLTTTGFTFIEILIVMLIISIAATFVVLRFGDFGQARRVENTAKELNLLLQAAQQQAVLQPAVLGWVLKSNGFAFYQFVVHQDITVNGKYLAEWQPLQQDRLFSFQPLPRNVVLRLQVNNKAVPPITDDEQTVSPRLQLLPSGYVTPFVLKIGARGKPAAYEITGNTAGLIQLQDAKAHDQS